MPDRTLRAVPASEPTLVERIIIRGADIEDAEQGAQERRLWANAWRWDEARLMAEGHDSGEVENYTQLGARVKKDRRYATRCVEVWHDRGRDLGPALLNLIQTPRSEAYDLNMTAAVKNQLERLPSFQDAYALIRDVPKEQREEVAAVAVQTGTSMSAAIRGVRAATADGPLKKVPKDGTAQHRVLEPFLDDADDEGRGLSDEDIETITGIPYSKLGPRRRELEAMGLVADYGYYRENQHGQRVKVRHLTDDGAKQYSITGYRSPNPMRELTEEETAARKAKAAEAAEKAQKTKAAAPSARRRSAPSAAAEKAETFAREVLVYKEHLWGFQQNFGRSDLDLIGMIEAMRAKGSVHFTSIGIRRGLKTLTEFINAWDKET